MQASRFFSRERQRSTPTHHRTNSILSGLGEHTPPNSESTCNLMYGPGDLLQSRIPVSLECEDESHANNAHGAGTVSRVSRLEHSHNSHNSHNSHHSNTTSTPKTRRPLNLTQIVSMLQEQQTDLKKQQELLQQLIKTQESQSEQLEQFKTTLNIFESAATDKMSHDTSPPRKKTKVPRSVLVYAII